MVLTLYCLSTKAIGPKLVSFLIIQKEFMLTSWENTTYFFHFISKVSFSKQNNAQRGIHMLM